MGREFFLAAGRFVRLLLPACLLLAGGAFAEVPNIESGPGPDSESANAIDQLRLSDALADYGEQHADALALIEAAKLRKTLPPPLNVSSGSAKPRTWDSLLLRAGQLAGPNPATTALIADVRRLKVRQIPIIPSDIRLLHKTVKQNAADRAEVSFGAGELAVVYLRPATAAALNLLVYDELNNLICTGNGHDAECRWRPRRTGSYLIDVQNDSPSAVEYELAINREVVER